MGGEEKFQRRVCHQRGPIEGSSLEPGMLVTTTDGDRSYTDRVKSIGRDGVTLGSRQGGALMFDQERAWELVEDFEGDVIDVGAFATGPLAHVQDGAPRWWVWTHRRIWTAVPGPTGWSGLSPLPDVSQLEPATVTGATELTGLAMVHGPTQPVLAMLWGQVAEGTRPSSRFPEVWISPTTGDVLEDPEIAHHLRLIPAG